MITVKLEVMQRQVINCRYELLIIQMLTILHASESAGEISRTASKKDEYEPAGLT